jgi:hypothetical protein
MGVHLRRSEALVSEQLLHDAQVGTTVEEVRGKGVAQRMRMKCFWETCGTCDVVESRTGTTLSKRSAVAIQEECRGLGRGEASERRSTI